VLNATGKLGHAHLGVSICLDGNLPAVKELVSKYRSDISKGLRHIESHPEIIAESEECVFILAGSRISEHLISNVASILNRSVYGSKPLFAFAAAGEGKTKVSARISEALEGQINLKEIMEKICSEVGGQGGGHHAAAGGTISSEAEETFIKLVRDILKGLRAKQEKEAVPVLSSQKEEEREDDRKDAKKIKLEGKGLVRYLSP